MSKYKCPRCGDDIVYNGNYFCQSWRIDWCGWALMDDKRGREQAEEFAKAIERGEIERVSY